MRTARALFLLPLAAFAACGDSSAPAEPAHETAGPSEFVPQRPEFEAIAEKLATGDSELLSKTLSIRMRAALENPALTGKDRLGMRIALAGRVLRDGNVAEAIEMYSALLAEAKPGSKRHLQAVRDLAIAHLRDAEVKNCISRHNADCCLFPLQGGALHTVDEPARLALEGFLEFLKAKPNHLRTRWLANVCALALGEHPDALPPEQVVPASAFASEYELAHYPDIAGKLGIDTFNQCGGVATEDFDQDGFLDILTSTFDPLGALTHYRSRGDGTFEDISSRSHADDQLGGLNLVAADYDGDGDQDVIVLRGAWLTVDGRIRNSLLRNDGGVFVDVTRDAGLAEPAMPTQAAVWADFDNDGDLDLYIANESMVKEDPNQDFPSQLFRNNGDGTFTDVAAEAGVTNDSYGKAVTVGDFDDDGDVDLYVSNFGPNRLYRNDGGLRFTDVAPELGVTEPEGRSFASWFFDYDNDGKLDLLSLSYSGSSSDLVAEKLHLKRTWPRPRLYHNLGGRFEEVGKEAGLDRFILPMGANFGDIDGDGWLDLYLTTGDPSLESIVPNVMLRNDGGRTFQDVTTAGGFGHLQKGHGVSFCDLDNDGDQDVYHQLGGFYYGDRYQNAFFENPGNGNHFLTLKLVGTTSNRDAVGARVSVVVRTPGGTRTLHRSVGSLSSFGGSPHRQELGLGDATGIEEVRIRWPRTQQEQVFRDLSMDAFYRIVEGEEQPERLERKRLVF
ncbi:MAG TPA: CRTAC1 family protein [Planctomycetes bacterium]|nr:CRTAC1 family protein [Planctomycetota bacterium]